jgi:hypothetical protein
MFSSCSKISWKFLAPSKTHPVFLRHLRLMQIVQKFHVFITSALGPFHDKAHGQALAPYNRIYHLSCAKIPSEFLAAQKRRHFCAICTSAHLQQSARMGFAPIIFLGRQRCKGI